MIRIEQLSEAHQIQDDFEMWREVYGYMSVCLAELMEYADEIDLEESGFNFIVATQEDADYIKSLGTPEEVTSINISDGHTKRQIQRMIYITEVVFMEVNPDVKGTISN